MSLKTAYQEKFQAQLNEWNAQIEVLKAQRDKAEADAKIGYERHIQDLQGQYDAAQSKLKEMQSSSEAAWEEMKSGMEHAWDSMTTAIKNASSRFTGT
ncbi:MAG: hypothetical protein K2Y29_05890 [Beijerinckiaceae bacterium]|nr:hypothetical protein [Beijerinckiaceae bacterium]